MRAGTYVIEVPAGTRIDGTDRVVTDDNAVVHGNTIYVTKPVYERLKAELEALQAGRL